MEYTLDCQHQNVHIPQKNQHAGNNLEVMGGISPVGSGSWDEMEGPAISGSMNKGAGSKESVFADLQGREKSGRKNGVREMQLVQERQGVAVPSAALTSLTLC